MVFQTCKDVNQHLDIVASIKGKSVGVFRAWRPVSITSGTDLTQSRQAIAQYRGYIRNGFNPISTRDNAISRFIPLRVLSMQISYLHFRT